MKSQSRPLPRVLLDVVGVLADIVSSLVAHLNARYGTGYTLASVTQWEIDHLIPDGDVRSFWQSFAGSVRASDLPVYPGAIEGVARLQELADVYVVTAGLSSSRTWMHDREQWLFRHFGIPSKRVVHTSAKHLIVGDVLIDDKFETVVNWAACHPDGVGLLWDRPWNRIGSIADMGISDLHEASDMGIDNLARVKSWDDVLKISARRPRAVRVSAAIISVRLSAFMAPPILRCAPLPPWLFSRPRELFCDRG